MDSRRRGVPTRPASVEEMACWGHAADSLKHLSSIYTKSSTSDVVSRVNRLINAWPADDTSTGEGLGTLKSLQTKLITGLTDISTASHSEVRAIDDALESIGVLIALRKAPESALPPAEKRKRPRASSPSGTPAPTPATGVRSMSITVPPRTSSVGPTAPRDARAKKDSTPKSQALLPGRKVAYRPPKGTETEEGTWIVAIVRRCLSHDKQGARYEVQDAEPQENGQPGLKYIANPKAMVPLPDPEAAPGSPGHLGAHPTFSVGDPVLALYPDTSCFYRAEVISVPTPDRSSPSTKYVPAYNVKFEDDDDMIHSVSAYWVVQFPQHLL
ncbi:SAGA-associated factor 29 [Psilocybe cubensis]|uniref:SAGA-associated factor 29 n=2 Tax=Psilocybe cubensis TaxID=181762 RepID=A0ACB8GY77_PSICU|nr:SAGA-associated factor 29 [Psilocybe cubensis]KAH9480526.1 SAGA-associated factor 29 [Psilocybe cubensis]